MLRYIDWMFTLRFSLHVRSYDMNDDHQWRTHIIQSGDYLIVCVDHDSTQSMTNAQSFYQYKFAAFDNGKIKNWFKCKSFGRTLNYMCLICIRQSLAALVRHMNRQCGLSRRIHRDRVTQSTIWCPPIQYQYCSRSVGHTKICSPQQRINRNSEWYKLMRNFSLRQFMVVCVCVVAGCMCTNMFVVYQSVRRNDRLRPMQMM